MSAAMNAAAFICMQMQGHRQGSHMLVCCLFFETSAGCTGRAAASDSDGHATPQGTMAEISTMSVRKAAAAVLEAGEVSLGDVPGSAGLRPTSGCAALPSKTSGCPQTNASTTPQRVVRLLPACLFSKLSSCLLRIWKVMGLSLRECCLMMSMALTRVVREGLLS